MPKPRRVLNAFPVEEVTRITGISRPMVDYLTKQGFLTPAYGSTEGTRGKVRYYSYRDLVVARLIQRLRDTGVELRKLKDAVIKLNAHKRWRDGPNDPATKIRWLLSDGKRMYIKDQYGFLEEVQKGQRAFGFVVNLDHLETEVMRKVRKKQRPYCSINNGKGLIIEPLQKKRSHR
jgi:DNA-binding transcriptional MerR regulator